MQITLDKNLQVLQFRKFKHVKFFSDGILKVCMGMWTAKDIKYQILS